MEKWADYLITAVKWSSDPKHIDSVEVRPYIGDAFWTPSTRTRTKVIEELDGGKTFVTAVEKNGGWIKGEDVRVVVVGGNRYIRTDANSTAADNLGELPTF